MTASRSTGTQSIERAILVLREIAKHGKVGWCLGELAERCGLDRGTTHRILACLVLERMVQQRKSNRHYLPGPLIFELGLAIPAYKGLQDVYRPLVKRVAKYFSATSVFYLRSGIDWVCAARAGPAVYGGTILEVGTRRPLLASVGGVAILMTLPRHEADAIVTKNKWQMRRRSNASIMLLENMLRRSEALGYAFNQGEVSRGVHSFGVPVCDAGGSAFASLTAAARSTDFPISQAPEVIKVLREEAARIEHAAERMFPA